jgi:hypothetical protein
MHPSSTEKIGSTDKVGHHQLGAPLHHQARIRLGIGILRQDILHDVMELNLEHTLLCKHLADFVKNRRRYTHSRKNKENRADGLDMR